MITEEQLQSLTSGTVIRYGFYAGVMFDHVDDRDHVVMKDKGGGTKRVYKHLFLKHAEIEAPKE